MIISYNWLSEYLPEPIPLQELCRILTSLGLEVEGTETAEAVKGSLRGLVTGHVVACGRHPNADKLSVTKVDIGTGELISIVCGAPNVAEGQKVIVAPVGATVYPLTGEPFQIKKAKIRGEDSQGMICAEDEIGLGSSHAGIIILPEDVQVGILASDYYQLPATDYSIAIGLTPNRSDANSHMGVARDVCAYLSYHKNGVFAIKKPTGMAEGVVGKAGQIKVTIEAPQACKRYAGIELKGVKVGPSPEWLSRRLATIGVRSINNIVDVTNYVLHEYGQPLHAFDADQLQGQEIRVRFEAEGALFTTLDGVERKMKPEDLMICDGAGPVAMGGVFGGLKSGITESTSRVFLESAYFDPQYIRRTSLRHGLRTDAAQHFEKGVDIDSVLPALLRAAGLIMEVAGGQVDAAVTDVYPELVTGTKIEVTYEYICRLAGKKYPAERIDRLLAGAGFEIIHRSDAGLTLGVPTNKVDITQPADIVEEVLRIDGLDNIAIPDRLNITLMRTQNGDLQLREKVASLLCGMGLQEIVTNSIVNSKYYPEHTDLVRMINSLSSELDVMRPSMTESGLEVVAYNCNRKQTDLALYELGNVYSVQEGKYHQEPRLSIWLTGAILSKGWEKKTQDSSVFYAKGLVRNLAQYSGIPTTLFTMKDNEVVVMWKNNVLCRIYEVPQARLAEFGIKQKVVTADIFWNVWVKAAESGKTKYREVPRFPAVERDLAIVLDKAVTYEQVAKATDQLKLEGLVSYDLFDIFESEKLGAGKKSFALNYVFQAQDRTLTDAETGQMMAQLSAAYKNQFNAIIRE